MGGDTSEMNLARAQFDEEEHVDGLQPDGFHGKKVTGQDLLLVMGHELPPTNGAVANWSGENVVTVEDVAHGCQGNLETQFEQFTHNLAITKAGVLSSEKENQVLNLLADCWSTTLVFCWDSSIYDQLNRDAIAVWFQVGRYGCDPGVDF